MNGTHVYNSFTSALVVQTYNGHALIVTIKYAAAYSDRTFHECIQKNDS